MAHDGVVFAHGPVTYMDVQKTGSTFVCTVLDRVLREPASVAVKHGRMERDKAPGEIAVISTREPLDAWLSLYNYGCTGVGRLRRRLERQGRAMLYDGTPEGFDAWVRVVGDPAHPAIAGEGYAAAAHLGMGFQNFRELVMSFAWPLQVFGACESLDDVVRYYRDRRAVDHRIRFASLREDLAALLEGPLAEHVRPGIDVRDVVGAAEPVNASPRTLTRVDVLEPTRQHVAATESLTGDIERTWSVLDRVPGPVI